jgi:membrane-associated phospholipid phosphatase
MVRAEASPSSFLIAVVVGGIVAPLVLFGALAVRASSVEASGSEQDFVEWTYRQTLPIRGAMDLFVDVGRLGGPLLVGLLAIGLLARAHVWESIFLVVALSGAAVLAVTAHVIVNALSSVPEGSSLDFPSGHAAASLSAVGAAIVLLRRRSWPITIFGIVLLVAYGAALVARNWHGPSEVVAGWCIGLAWLSAVWLGVALLQSRGRNLRPSPAAAKPT